MHLGNAPLHAMLITVAGACGCPKRSYVPNCQARARILTTEIEHVRSVFYAHAYVPTQYTVNADVSASRA